MHRRGGGGGGTRGGGGHDPVIAGMEERGGGREGSVFMKRTSGGPKDEGREWKETKAWLQLARVAWHACALPVNMYCL